MKRVFLGGTCNDSVWREELIPMLKCEYFNPVVKDWTPECQAEEIKQREECDFVLYVLTPKMTGFYSVAEVVDDSNKRPNKVIFCALDHDHVDPNVDIIVWSKHQEKSLDATAKMITANGGYVAANLKEVAEYLNTH